MANGPLHAETQSSPELALHFCYAEPKEYLAGELAQGDVLRRTEELDRVLESVHPYFHRHSKNLFFMVLTQSCDLAVRNGDTGKAPYINIAPVRPLDEVISREIENLQLNKIRSDLPLLTNKSRAKLADFTRRLLNNNVPQYFYLESDGTELGQDCCAFLRLSIAIKSDLHYQACVEAKFLQLNDSFQAKLGSLVGQLYSRVGTKDWEARQLETKVSQLTKDAAFYLEDEKVRQLEGKFAPQCAADPNYFVDTRELTAAIKAIPTKKKTVVDLTIEIAAECLKLDDAAKTKLLGRLQGDQTLTKELS